MKDVSRESEFSGDFCNGALDFGWDIFDKETKLVKSGVELNQGCAAIMGILGTYGTRAAPMRDSRFWAHLNISDVSGTVSMSRFKHVYTSII